MNRCMVAFLAAATLVTTSSPAWSQVLYGSIVGNVKDSSDAAVPSATVIVKETGTGFTRETTTNETGQFQFAAVPGGSYEISVAKTGFTTFTAKSVAVR